MGATPISPNINDNRNIVPLEDLAIYAELRALLPKRSIVNNTQFGGIMKGELDNIDDGSQISFTFPFNNAQEGRPSLTTSWTNIGGRVEEKTTEGLGITNIDIQFDASFVPRVSIRLRIPLI